MLFNSTEFLTLFLPVTLAGFFVLGRYSRESAAWWLAGASVVFYAGWNWRYVPLLLASTVFNFVAAQAIARMQSQDRPARAKLILIAGVAANLVLLGYYKYTDFLIANWNSLTNSNAGALMIVLPLGISFFTFTQIAYLVDTARKVAYEPRFSHYLLFVTYFPHLIAGPVLHHKEMMPQFADPVTYRWRWENVAAGTAIFLIGLFKKTVLADGISEHVGSAFALASQGQEVHALQAWGAALSFTMQLYFDFSGYSDMAIGLARLFGVRLPLNFHSPYKSRNISDFWRRWHMTLSRFLRDYLYISLGGNRHGSLRRYTNLVLTMFLGGLWHGASWTFAIWGLMHGGYLVINHAFQAICRAVKMPPVPDWLKVPASITITYLAVVVAWVFFRADTVSSALRLLTGMFGGYGVALPDALLLRIPGLEAVASALNIRSELGGGSVFVTLWLKLAVLHFIAFAMPNTQEIMRRFAPALDFNAQQASGMALRFNWRWAALIGCMGTLGLFAMTRRSEFLYYQF